MKHLIQLKNKQGQVIRNIETDCKRDECQRLANYLKREVCGAYSVEVDKVRKSDE